MKRVHIVGRKNHGKTTLIEELIGGLRAQGLRVATIKHTHHDHELDVPGKDSYRHRVAGAAVVGILSRSMNAAFWDVDNTGDDDSLDWYESFHPILADCDIVLVEGDVQARAPKVEVWRAALGSEPIAKADRSIAAIVTDDAVDVAVPVFPRSDTSAVLRWLVGTFHN